MKLMRIGLAAAAAAAAVAVVPGVAHACSCAPPKPPRKAVEDFDAVFAGTVVATEDARAGAPLRGSADPILYTFTVDSVAKGTVGRIEHVTSARFAASCGFRFREGRRYLVFAYHADDERGAPAPGDRLATNLCTPTMEVGADEALPVAADAVEDDGAGPETGDDAAGEGWPWAGGVAGVAVALVAAILVWLRLRPAR